MSCWLEVNDGAVRWFVFMVERGEKMNMVVLGRESLNLHLEHQSVTR